ncbi:MAG: HlyD family type I secretion periplasmic adaptor subunit [Pikeienuella sp.]
MNKPDSKLPKTELTGVGRLAAIAVVGLLIVAVSWASLTRIKGAVIASGAIAVVGKPKSVQHLDGGVVEAILTADGEKVAEGQSLIRLDGTLLSANLEIYRNRLAVAQARKARLTAEREGADTITFGIVGSLVKGVDIEVRRAGQQEVFETRAAVRAGRRAQLDEKINQFGNQVLGVEALTQSKKDQLTFLEIELNAVKSLEEKGLARAPQLLSLQRSAADLLGQIAEHQSELARISNSIRDTELEILQGENQFREETVSELTETTATIEELTQQILSTEKQLERIDIKSPVGGVVHELQVTTIGGVVAPGATVVQIIPLDRGYEIEARVDPVAIDQLFIGQQANLRFVALNQRTTPELLGQITAVSPDIVYEEATGLSYYRARIEIDKAERSRLGDIDLIPGMPVEAFVQTDDRTVMSYLLRPLADQLGRAFREE